MLKLPGPDFKISSYPCVRYFPVGTLSSFLYFSFAQGVLSRENGPLPDQYSHLAGVIMPRCGLRGVPNCESTSVKPEEGEEVEHASQDFGDLGLLCSLISHVYI